MSGFFSTQPPVNVVPIGTNLIFNILADYGSNVPATCFVDAGAPDNGNGSNGDWYYRTDGGAGTTYYQKVSGSWVAVDETTIHVQVGSFQQGDAETAANNDLNLDFVVVLSTNPPAVDADFIEVNGIVRVQNVYSNGQAIVWDSGTSQWVQAEKLSPPSPIVWERLEWVQLLTGAGAPTSGTGGNGWFYFDTTGEDLYGPAQFDQGIPGWDWGSPLANVDISNLQPADESTADWHVWDEFDDGTSWVLYQKKTGINYNDMLFWSGSNWEARSQKISGQNVYSDLSDINTAIGVASVAIQINNAFLTMSQAFSGHASYFVEENISSAYEVNPFNGNGFVLTLTDDTTVSFSANWDPDSQLGTRFCELTIVLKQDATGGWITTWDSNVKVSSGTTLTTTADAVDMLKAVSWDYGTTWYVTQIGADFA